MFNRITVEHFSNKTSSPELQKQHECAAALLTALLTNNIIVQSEVSKYIAQYTNLSATEAYALSIKISEEYSLTEKQFIKGNFTFLSMYPETSKEQLKIYKCLLTQAYFRMGAYDKYQAIVDIEMKNNFACSVLSKIKEEILFLNNIEQECYKSKISYDINSSLNQFEKYELYFLCEIYLTNSAVEQNITINKLKKQCDESKYVAGIFSTLYNFIVYLHSSELREYCRKKFNYSMPHNDLIDKIIEFNYEPAYQLAFQQHFELAKTNSHSFNLLKQLWIKIPIINEHANNFLDASFDPKVRQNCCEKFEALKFYKIKQIKLYIEEKILSNKEQPWSLGWMGSRYNIEYEGKNVLVPKGIFDIYEWVKYEMRNKYRKDAHTKDDVLTQIEAILSTKNQSNPFATLAYTIAGCATSNETIDAYDQIAIFCGKK
jgi:hypothetical protein